jgi:uncharacterized protein (DUF1697 family)
MTRGNYILTMPSTSPTRYVALLRGINVGGNRVIKMEALRAAFEKLGFKKVKTILAAGNVLFESRETDQVALGRRIEAGLEKALGHRIGVVLRSISQIERLDTSAPFKGVTVTPATRLWVTFLPGTVKGKTEIMSVIQLSDNLRAGMDQMASLDKKYGKDITTRSWSTIGKILKAARDA